MHWAKVACIHKRELPTHEMLLYVLLSAILDELQQLLPKHCCIHSTPSPLATNENARIPSPPVIDGFLLLMLQKELKLWRYTVLNNRLQLCLEANASLCSNGAWMLPDSLLLHT
jgi:hypothetical protein